MTKASAFSKLGNITSATRARAGEVWDVAAEAGYRLTRLWGMGPGDEHGVGRAIDFMITGSAGGKAAGDFIAEYLWANRKRLGLKWLIWDREIWSMTLVNGKPKGKTRYRGKNPHTDHVHAFFSTAKYVAPPKGGGGGGVPDDGIPGWWHVDPARVSTFLWGLKGGTRKNIKAKPRRNIRIVREATLRGKKWLVTGHDNWFAKYYLNKGRS